MCLFRSKLTTHRISFHTRFLKSCKQPNGQIKTIAGDPILLPLLSNQLYAALFLFSCALRIPGFGLGLHWKVVELPTNGKNFCWCFHFFHLLFFRMAITSLFPLEIPSKLRRTSDIYSNQKKNKPEGLFFVSAACGITLPINLCADESGSNSVA